MHSHVPSTSRTTAIPRTNQAPNPTTPPVTYTSRPLPSGDCGYDAYGSPCRCQSFWPSPGAIVLCACGHHACYHAHEKRSSYNSIPTNVATIERRIAEIAVFLKNLRSSLPARAQSREAEDRILEIEDRLRGVEVLSLGLEHRIDDLETRGDMIENELDNMREEEGGKTLASPAPTIAPSSPALDNSISQDTAERTPHVDRITTRTSSPKRPHVGDEIEEPSVRGKRLKKEDENDCESLA